MSGFRDSDLEDALRPLAGDPADDWARVMAALPERPVARSPFRPRVLPWLAAATAAGLVVGFVAARLAPREQPPPTQVRVADAAPAARLVGKAGDLFVETDAGVQAVAVGDPITLDRFVGTAEEGRAFVVLPGDVELRLNKSTRVALLGPRSLELAKGQLFVSVPSSSGPVHLATLEGEVVARPGAVQVTASDGRLEVVALKGNVRFEGLAGDRVDVETGSVFECVDGVLGEVRTIELPWDHIAWQVDMLAGCPDRREEAYSWTWSLVDALDVPRTASRAERALRGSGPVGAMVLGMAAYDLPADREVLRKRCWLLLAQVGDASSLPYLLGGPSSEDADVRAATVEAIERLTAIPSGRDLEFWREAPPAIRYDVLVDWRARLRDF